MKTQEIIIHNKKLIDRFIFLLDFIKWQQQIGYLKKDKEVKLLKDKN